MTYLYDNGSLVISWRSNLWSHPPPPPVIEISSESEVEEDNGRVIPPLEMAVNRVSRNGLVVLVFN